MASGAEALSSPAGCSSRFARALAAERARLARRRERVLARVGKQRQRLAGAEREAAVLERRIAELGTLADGEDPRPHRGGDGDALAGRAIREVAIGALLARSPRGEAIHYRDWLALLREAGYEVRGRRPDAVFLNQVTRSPLVRAGRKPGLYELDLEAPRRLRERLRELQRALGNLAEDEPAAGGGPEDRAQRAQELSREARSTRRRLEEARRCIADAPHEVKPERSSQIMEMNAGPRQGSGRA